MYIVYVCQEMSNLNVANFFLIHELKFSFVGYNNFLKDSS